MIDTLFSEVNISTSKEETTQISTELFFINFINKLEGFKTKCKNLHWSAPKKNIHVYLDEFLDVISDYQDSIAEDAGLTNEQYYLDWEDYLNKISVMEH